MYSLWGFAILFYAIIGGVYGHAALVVPKPWWWAASRERPCGGAIWPVGSNQSVEWWVIAGDGVGEVHVLLNLDGNTNFTWSNSIQWLPFQQPTINKLGTIVPNVQCRGPNNTCTLQFYTNSGGGWYSCTTVSIVCNGCQGGYPISRDDCVTAGDLPFCDAKSGKQVLVPDGQTAAQIDGLTSNTFNLNHQNPNVFTNGNTTACVTAYKEMLCELYLAPCGNSTSSYTQQKCSQALTTCGLTELHASIYNCSVFPSAPSSTSTTSKTTTTTAKSTTGTTKSATTATTSGSTTTMKSTTSGTTAKPTTTATAASSTTTTTTTKSTTSGTTANPTTTASAASSTTTTTKSTTGTTSNPTTAATTTKSTTGTTANPTATASTASSTTTTKSTTSGTTANPTTTTTTASSTTTTKSTTTGTTKSATTAATTSSTATTKSTTSGASASSTTTATSGTASKSTSTTGTVTTSSTTSKTTAGTTGTTISTTTASSTTTPTSKRALLRDDGGDVADIRSDSSSVRIYLLCSLIPFFIHLLFV